VTTFAIGDVQGCHDPLRRLLDRIKFDPARDRLWFCGDLVNRGGQSLEVLRLVKSLDANSVVVLGNHDLSLLAIAQRKESDQRKVNPDLQRVLFADDHEPLLNWLRRRPLFHRDTKLGYAMVHAGLAPKWTLQLAARRAREVQLKLRGKNHRKLLSRMYGNKPDAWSPKLEGMERLRAIINVMTRLRYCNVRGKIDFDEKGPPGTQEPGLYPWFEVPGQVQRELRVVTGHWSTLGLVLGMGVCAIDTGCVWGGPLTALELGPEPRVIQVPGKAGARGGND
jgi:bis(5'-nucleosyl)-tetraphosphatase (symmetrical)